MPDSLSRAVEPTFLGWDGRAHGLFHALVAAVAQDGIVLAVALVMAGAWWAASGSAGDRLVDAVLRLVPGAVAVAIAFALAHVAGLLLPESRPFVLLGQPALFAHAPDASFPSDHVSGGMALLASRVGPGARTATAIVVVAVGIARVASGVHWPDDIVGGAIIGLAVAWLVSSAWSAVLERVPTLRRA